MTPNLHHRRRVLAFGSSTLLSLALGGTGRAATSRPIALWGDSLTFGIGANTVAGKYPNALGPSFSPPREVFNGGIGGETSTEIAARMIDDEIHRDWIAVIWAGRNNFRPAATVLTDIAAMAAHLRHHRFLVLSIPNADVTGEHRGAPGHTAIVALNETLRQRYADHYIDIRRDLVGPGLGMLGLAPTANDLRDIALDVPPAALRADHVHLNDAGQAIVTRRVHDAILRHGW